MFAIDYLGGHFREVHVSESGTVRFTDGKAVHPATPIEAEVPEGFTYSTRFAN